MAVHRGAGIVRCQGLRSNGILCRNDCSPVVSSLRWKKVCTDYAEEETHGEYGKHGGFLLGYGVSLVLDYLTLDGGREPAKGHRGALEIF
jgi:hypothetical protein